MHHTEKSLVQLLEEAGIKTVYIDPKSKIKANLIYKGKTIFRPNCQSLYRIVLEEFGIDLTTFND